MLIRLLPEFAALFVLVFARVGALVMFLPGLGEQTVPMRARLAFALLLTLLFMPVARPLITVDLARPEMIVGLLFTELSIGIMIGAAIRLSLSAMQTAGTIISQQIGLSFAAMFDPVTRAQSAAISTFLVLSATAMVFALDLHHLSIRAIHDSYALFAPGSLPATGDAAQLALRTAAGAFAIGVQMSLPFLVFGIVFNLGLGVLSRLMPQLQIFFLAMPATIMLGTLVLLATFGAIVGGYVLYLERLLGELIVR